ncbi:TonB-dependent receptor [Sphingomonas sp. NFR15]|uniref:TonB-dependent receptor n=1 Tax=Sphingomonas sp. NFR15 TaxID=1566282 RepID=UPI000883298B|nr:TonB-dependent receptor [Sphingomonas sp. NFR15]SDA34062.1 Outer membrane receptor proteins, mostly Fe transport [Sphingomonas sp. NFR15]
MPLRILLLCGCALFATPAFADDQPAPAQAPANQPADQPKDIVVTGRLDAARASIQPSLGATTYSISNATIQALPGGDNQQLNQILLQLPGVSQDGAGQLHVRDDHANLQYRINGTILPEGIAVFGQTLSPRLVDRFDLRTGALPAQYGLRTAGIIDITTKSGFQNGGEVSLYGGSRGTIEPSVEYGGNTGNTNYFVTASYRHNDLGIESVDGSTDALHDTTNQYQGFVYLDHTIDDGNRVSLIGGYSDQRFQIPNPRGLHPDSGYSVGGVTDFLSDDLDERQHEKTAFGILSLLHDAGPVTLQGSIFARYSLLQYTPDVLGELLFNGIAQAAKKQDFTTGVQVEGVYRLSGAHTLRGGFVVTRDHGTSRTSTQVFPVDASGAQTGQPIAIADNGSATEMTYSVYLQDEWQPIDHVTINFGGRFDHYDGYRSEQQLSPRVNAVWSPPGGFTIHAGYARYFSPAPFANVATTTIAKFVGTSGAAPGTYGDVPFAERQDYFDIGAEQKIGPVTIGVDAYHRRSRNLLDEGQFGAPIILTPFNYRRGRIDGIEGNISYTHRGWLIYGNIAHAKAQGTDISSGQFNFDPADLATISRQYIYLDHDQTWTGSAGASYRFDDGILRDSKLAASMIYGSGLRRDGAVPNGGKLPGYAVFNISASHSFKGPGIEVRADVFNLFDHVYEIRDGSGVGVGAPQYGQRRGFFFGISKSI